MKMMDGSLPSRLNRYAALRISSWMICELTSLPQLLLGIQELLDSPNENSPAQKEAYTLYVTARDQYLREVRKQATKYPPQVGGGDD